MGTALIYKVLKARKGKGFEIGGDGIKKALGSSQAD